MCNAFARFSKHAQVVYTREVYKYARGTNKIRARRESHETIKKWELLESSRALLTILCKVSTTLVQILRVQIWDACTCIRAWNSRCASRRDGHAHF